MKKIFIAICGMPGSGKSEVADFFVAKGFEYIRLGQITLDEVKKHGLSGEKAEKEIRENFRNKHGMAAFAILNIQKIKKMTGNVIIDGLYSWEEYLYFKEKLKNFSCMAIYASPKTRYKRLTGRAKKHGADPNLKYRSFSINEAISRDKSEIEKLNKGGPIVMADFTIINEGSKKDLEENLNKIYRKINAKKK